MSRALTVWNRRDAGSQYDNSEVERIMAQQGCSEPVAKNLIKYAKLGVGPLANVGQRDPDDDRHGDRDRASGSSRDQFPPRLDRKAAAALAEAKLRERQEQEEEDELRLRAAQQPKKKIGIARLGPVMAREEEVDPYTQSSRPAKKGEEDDNEAEDKQGLAIFEARKNLPRNGMGGMFKKPMQIGGISSLGAVMARASEVDPLESQGPSALKGEEDDEVEEEDVQGDDDKTRQFMDKKRAQDENKWKAQQGGKKKKQRRDREASQSQESEDEASRDAKRSFGHEREGSNREESQASGSLMSEKQVMAMMGKQRKEGTKRGSVRARTRIQNEREEWERAKANNPEFWKAPQFALCYSAETGKKARGAG